MKRADLKVGQTYAWKYRSSSPGLPATVLDVDRLYERDLSNRTRMVAQQQPDSIKPSIRTVASKGDEYPHVEVGILVRREDGSRDLARPLQLVSTWTDYLAERYAQDQRQREAVKALNKRRDADNAVRDQLAKVIANSPYAGRINVGTTRTPVDNALLIEILEKING